MEFRAGEFRSPARVLERPEQLGEARKERMESLELGRGENDGRHDDVDGIGIDTGMGDQEIEHAELRQIFVMPAKSALAHYDAAVERDGFQRRLEVRRVVGEDAQ